MKSIVLKSDEVKVLQATGKVTIRRIVKPQPPSLEILHNQCPYGPGEKLWVKESVATNGPWNIPEECNLWYPADGGEQPKGYQRRSPILMPKWACRLWLEIVSVRAEWLQLISWQDCKAEGIALVGDELVFNNRKQKQSLMRTKFKRRWDSINATRGYNWEKNPYVWRISFKRIEK